MAIAALGTDTGGSCRIPAALCGTVGYKPTASRIPRDGVTPLSFSLDSIGSFGASVGCVAAIDAVMAGAPVAPVVARPAASLRLGVVRNLVLDELDGDVARTYDAALRALAVAGTQLVDVTLSCLGRLPALATKGSLTAPEAAHWHRALIATKGNVYDPRVRTRIELGATQTAVEYLELLAERRAFIAELDTSTRGLDALVMPTCPIVAPPMAAFDTDDAFRRLNLLLLRNTLIGNLADRCSISLPCHAPGGPPVGFMLTGERGADADLFAIAAGVEHVLDEMRGSGRPVL
jgi:aspartyl-tRNA(Asn)/glutamyl-tRNA(Gln) amidotransferase subunit A